ncbi:hypothetical protein T11_832 [Trichinella zimbabwensis]|uniref:Uncharacterized protein n=1 Tax=Trichinella zimbabwensis TaxID=268475 RepID=A0A0V1GIX4_9BILA|nr:hypothetical protein T11_832 [Trichinella zimbabwensis]
MQLKRYFGDNEPQYIKKIHNTKAGAHHVYQANALPANDNAAMPR